MIPVRPLKDAEFVYKTIYLCDPFGIGVLRRVGGITG